nr:precorrin-6A synthase (deacetylating) [Rhizobium sp. Q54]
MTATEQSNRDNKTEARRLAEQYVGLGGRRKSKVDDNITDIREWKDDPPEAETFWMAQIEPLDEERRKEVEFFLPSINNP